jgi:hypothetical protein
LGPYTSGATVEQLLLMLERTSWAHDLLEAWISKCHPPRPTMEWINFRSTYKILLSTFPELVRGTVVTYVNASLALLCV